MPGFLFVASAFLAASSGLFFFRVRSPARAAFTVPKMLVSNGAAFFTGIGIVIAVVAIRREVYVAALLCGIAVSVSLRYLLRVGASHEGFERAFGPDWRLRIGRDRQRVMLRRRWVGRLPHRPAARWERDIVFWRIPGSDRALYCDVWQPPKNTRPSRTAFIYLHGSGWHWADKDFNTRPFFRHLCAQGHVVMDVAYRLCPEVDLYGMLGDVKRAVAWLKENAANYDIDPERITLGGGSAGGHLALLAAYSSHLPELTPEDVSNLDLSVAGVVSYYGPVDMRAYYDHAGATLGNTLDAREKASRDEGIPSKISDSIARLLMGDLFDRIKDQDFSIGHRTMMANLLGGQPDEVPRTYELASPITHAGSNSPPTLLLQGEHDSLVPASACRALHHKLVRTGVRAVHVEYPQTEHAFDIAFLARYSPAGQAALYDLERFLALVS